MDYRRIDDGAHLPGDESDISENGGYLFAIDKINNPTKKLPGHLLATKKWVQDQGYGTGDLEVNIEGSAPDPIPVKDLTFDTESYKITYLYEGAQEPTSLGRYVPELPSDTKNPYLAEFNGRPSWEEFPNADMAETDENKPTYVKNKKQADWDQADENAIDFIKNKPDISNLSGVEIITINNSSLTERLDEQYAKVASAVSNKKLPIIKINSGTTSRYYVFSSISAGAYTDYYFYSVNNNFNTHKTFVYTIYFSGSTHKITHRYHDLSQADWSQTDDTAMDFIKNKPSVIQWGKAGHDLYNLVVGSMDPDTKTISMFFT